jgi:hypothetical protein
LVRIEKKLRADTISNFDFHEVENILLFFIAVSYTTGNAEAKNA